MEKQKAFARVCVGMCGRVRLSNVVHVQLENHDPDEAFDPWQVHWYRTKGFTVNEDTMMMYKNSDAVDIKNLFDAFDRFGGFDHREGHHSLIRLQNIVRPAIKQPA